MIPFFDYRPERERLRGELDAAVERVLQSGRLVLGDEVLAFEEEFAEFVELPHAIGVNSGTDAIVLALRACDIGHGDEVITTSNSGVPTISAIRATGALPRFVDVLPDTLQLDPAGLEAACTPATRAIVPVHLYGQPVDLAPVLAFARRRKLRVIEDCAQAHGTRYGGIHAGGHGDLGCFSFYPTKNLGAYGDGGMVVTRDAALAQSVRERRMYGYRDAPYAHVEGLNSRLDELQAAVLRVKLRGLQQSIDRRREIAAGYRARLEGAPLICQSSAFESAGLPIAEAAHAYHLFVISVENRDGVRQALSDKGVMTGVHYPHAVHTMDAYRELVGPLELPASDHACSVVLSLPLYNEMPREDPDRVADRLLRVLGG